MPSSGSQTKGELFRDGRVEGIELEDGRVLECDVVVLCMGPWTGNWAQLGSHWLYCTVLSQIEDLNGLA